MQQTMEPVTRPEWMPPRLSTVDLIRWATSIYCRALDKLNERQAKKGLKPKAIPDKWTVKAPGSFDRLGGGMIGVYSQTAGISCVARTVACVDVCYAGADWFVNDRWNHTASNFEFTDAAMAHASNLMAWLTDPRGWERQLDSQLTILELQGVKYFRINGAGDLLPGQPEAWQRLISRHQKLYCWGYTRSWADNELLPPILSLANKSNMSLWASVDRVNINYWLDVGMPLGLAAVLVNGEADFYLPAN